MSSSPPSSTGPVGISLFPEEAWFALAIFLAVISLFHWSSVLHSKLARCRRPQNSADEESTHTSAQPRATARSLARLPLAAVNAFRVVAFRWTLEFGTYDLKVADIFLTLAYVAFLLGWTFVGTKDLAATQENVSRWSGRAGLLAASQFPLVTALGTKNNLVSLVTGIGYEKLNYIHRVTARSCFGLLLIHASGEIYSSGRFINQLLQGTWVRFGLTALSAFAILIIVSLRPIRTRVYELFFYIHFIAVFIFLLGAYFHTSETHVSYWIWPSFMFWALDRFMRVARVVVGNHLYFSCGRRARLQDATTELLSDDFVRVRVRRPPHFQWCPGQSAYLIMPSVSAFPLEAHPFSISSIDSSMFQPGAKYSAENGETSESGHWKELVFLINVRGGFTKRLKEAAAQHRIVKLLIDGPYGHAPNMSVYDTCILIAGGSGVTYTLPVFLNVIEAARKGSSVCRRVVFIWAVRDASHIEWISDALFRAQALTPSWLTVSIRIFATRGGIPFSVSESSSSRLDLERTPDKEEVMSKVSKEWATTETATMTAMAASTMATSTSATAVATTTAMRMMPSFVRVETGRPDLGAMLHGEVMTATGTMAVTVCGSQSLTRSVRRALRFPVSGPSSVLKGGPSVTLHVESFGYA